MFSTSHVIEISDGMIPSDVVNAAIFTDAKNENIKITDHIIAEKITPMPETKLETKAEPKPEPKPNDAPRKQSGGSGRTNVDTGQLINTKNTPNIVPSDVFATMWLDGKMSDANFVSTFGIKSTESLPIYVIDIVQWHLDGKITKQTLTECLKFLVDAKN